MLSDRIVEIVYINMEVAVGRRERLKKYIKNYAPNVKITKYNAVDRKTIYSDDNYKVWNNKTKQYLNNLDGSFNKMYSGVVGCYMSHYNVLKYIIRNYCNSLQIDVTDKVVLVLEDDCV